MDEGSASRDVMVMRASATRPTPTTRKILRSGASALAKQDKPIEKKIGIS